MHAIEEAFGFPPHRHLLTWRLERAAALLKGRYLSVTEIAINPKLYHQVPRSDNFNALWGNAGYKALGDDSRFRPLAPSVPGADSMPMPPIPK